MHAVVCTYAWVVYTARGVAVMWAWPRSRCDHATALLAALISSLDFSKDVDYLFVASSSGDYQYCCH